MPLEIGGVSPGSQHDRLVVNGPATLDGELSVSLINGFQPAPGDTFAILTCGSRGGQFATLNGRSFGRSKLSPVYASTSVTLNAETNRPALNTIGMSSGGQFQFRIVGEPDWWYSIQASSNLVDWITLLTTNTSSGVVEFVDPESIQFPHRFYRAFTE